MTAASLRHAHIIDIKTNFLSIDGIRVILKIQSLINPSLLLFKMFRILLLETISKYTHYLLANKGY